MVQNVQFLLMLPADGNNFTVGNGTHVCFAAKEKNYVDGFHKASISRDGVCNGLLGIRSEYSKPEVYTAFVIDPFGNKLEAIYNGFSV